MQPCATTHARHHADPCICCVTHVASDQQQQQHTHSHNTYTRASSHYTHTVHPLTHTTAQLGEARYDQTTYMGRLSHIQDLVDMKSLFLTSAEVDKAQALLAEYKRLGKLPPNTTDEEMWDAQKVRGSSTSP